MKWKNFTFYLFDTAQSVLEGIQRSGLVIMSLLRGQVKLQLFQSFNHLFLGLCFGRLLTTAMTQCHMHRESQILHNSYFKKDICPPNKLRCRCAVKYCMKKELKLSESVGEWFADASVVNSVPWWWGYDMCRHYLHTHFHFNVVWMQRNVMKSLW